MVAVSSAAAGLASTFALLVLFRSLGGVGSALFSTGLMSYLLAVVPRERMAASSCCMVPSFALSSFVDESSVTIHQSNSSSVSFAVRCFAGFDSRSSVRGSSSLTPASVLQFPAAPGSSRSSRATW